MRSGGIVTYLRSRFLRIFPGLCVALLFNVLVIGPLFTTLPLPAYLGNGQTWRNLAVNSVLIGRLVQLEYSLPGVFENNPALAAINGSLWTLPYEVWLYIGLAVIWAIGMLRSARRSNSLFAILLGVSILSGFGWLTLAHGTLVNFLRFALFFGCGSCLYMNRDRVPLNGALVVLLLLLTWGFWHTGFGRNALLAVALAYTVIWLAYVPAGPIRLYNRFGDYSYGLYIYAFPVQQSIAALRPDIQPLQMFWPALVVTLMLAFLSWHLVEKPAMSLKSRVRGPRPAGVPSS
jgi:peptidoglycan/LPS O-acetylase OafA/YrhL